MELLLKRALHLLELQSYTDGKYTSKGGPNSGVVKAEHHEAQDGISTIMRQILLRCSATYTHKVGLEGDKKLKWGEGTAFSNQFARRGKNRFRMFLPPDNVDSHCRDPLVFRALLYS